MFAYTGKYVQQSLFSIPALRFCFITLFHFMKLAKTAGLDGDRMKNLDGVRTIYSTSAGLCFTFSLRHLRAGGGDAREIPALSAVQARYQLKFQFEIRLRKTDRISILIRSVCTRDTRDLSSFRKYARYYICFFVAGRRTHAWTGEVMKCGKIR